VAPSDPSQTQAHVNAQLTSSYGGNLSGTSKEGVGGLTYGEEGLPTDDLDEPLTHHDGNAGLALTSQAKLSLMRKLARGTIDIPDGNAASGSNTTTGSNASGGGNIISTTSIVSSMNEATGLPSHIQPPMQYQQQLYTQRQQEQQLGTPSKCLLLSNMFDPMTEENPDFDLEIREDVSAEVSKLGQLIHIFVDKTSRGGFVYVKLGGVEQALAVVKQLNGRWFGNNQIRAEFYPEEKYNTTFQL